MALQDWFKRTVTYDCLIVDEVPDGMPVLDGEMKQLPLDGDMFLDSHLGLAYSREREIRPVRVRQENGTFKEMYILAKRAGAACGIVMIHEPVDRIFQVAGKTINVQVDELVLKIYTDPIMAYHIQDNKGLKTLLVQGLLGFEILIIFMIGLLLGSFVIGPLLSWGVATALHMLMGFGESINDGGPDRGCCPG